MTYQILEHLGLTNGQTNIQNLAEWCKIFNVRFAILGMLDVIRLSCISLNKMQ